MPDFKFPAELLGQRLFLAPLDDGGLDDFFEYSQIEDFYKYLEFPPQRSIEESGAYLKRLMTRSNADNAHYWFIRVKDTHKVIGTIGVHSIDFRKGDAEIGYGISPRYWGKGYFKEVVRLVLDFLFLQMEFHRVIATTRQDNTPSIRGLKKLGFRIEGCLREYYLSYDGQRHDAVILGLLRCDYGGK